MSAKPYVRRQSRRLTVALLADGLTFALFAALVGFGGLHTERNPVIAAAFALAGANGIVLLKAAAALAVEWRARRFPDRPAARRWLVPYAIVSSAVLAGTVVGAGFNLASLVASLR